VGGTGNGLSYRDDPLARIEPRALGAACRDWSAIAHKVGCRFPLDPVHGDPDEEEAANDERLRACFHNFDRWHQHIVAAARTATEDTGAARQNVDLTALARSLQRLRLETDRLAIERLATKRGWATCAATDLGAAGMEEAPAEIARDWRHHQDAHAAAYRRLLTNWVTTDAALQRAERDYDGHLRPVAPVPSTPVASPRSTVTSGAPAASSPGSPPLVRRPAATVSGPPATRAMPALALRGPVAFVPPPPSRAVVSTRRPSVVMAPSRTTHP
jgi:hypothetical protein